jgi:beta-N-acetylglucosaminidase
MDMIDSYQDNYSWDNLSEAMEGYAKYISEWEINNYRQNNQR